MTPKAPLDTGVKTTRAASLDARAVPVDKVAQAKTSQSIDSMFRPAPVKTMNSARGRRNTVDAPPQASNKKSPPPVNGVRRQTSS